MASYRDAILARQRERQGSLKAAFRAEAQRVALAAGERYRPDRIFLYGSLTGRRSLSVWSDIDLAVEGLDDNSFFPMLAYLLGESSHPIDLRPLEEIPEPWAHQIRTFGEVVYERSSF